jgi:L-alanine-DL-glutamate epimerase-like enolase superfamily enzyme
MKDTSIKGFEIRTYKIPTSTLEADGTLQWNSTVLLCIWVTALDCKGFGYTYADKATAFVAQDLLKEVVQREDSLCVELIWNNMYHHIRNLGRSGITSMAISAIDIALWDLKSKILQTPLVELFGSIRKTVSVYGSGGFTNYSKVELQSQLSEWARDGMKFVKMKIGTHPEDDVKRVGWAREAIGENVELFVDANGAYNAKLACEKSFRFAELGVTWFEEPVIAEDFEGTKFVRQHSAKTMNIASGEYGYNLNYFKRLLSSQSVDFLQADVTRCGGYTGFKKVAALAEAFNIPLSSHCAPTAHLPLGCSITILKHLEYFHDHSRIESLLFEGCPIPKDGSLTCQGSQPGIGVELKFKDAEKFLI